MYCSWKWWQYRAVFRFWWMRQSVNDTNFSIWLTDHNCSNRMLCCIIILNLLVYLVATNCCRRGTRQKKRKWNLLFLWWRVEIKSKNVATASEWANNKTRVQGWNGHSEWQFLMLLPFHISGWFQFKTDRTFTICRKIVYIFVRVLFQSLCLFHFTQPEYARERERVSEWERERFSEFIFAGIFCNCAQFLMKAHQVHCVPSSTTLSQ